MGLPGREQKEEEEEFRLRKGKKGRGMPGRHQGPAGTEEAGK